MKQKNILVVDDEAHIRELLRYNLENSGYVVEEAESGEDALQKIGEQTFDLVLLDVMLPGIDGLEVLRKIRQENDQRNLPVILLTAKGEEIDKVVGLELGADDYIAKPFGIYELQARIKTVFRRLEAYEVKEQPQEESIKINDLIINKSQYLVDKKGKSITLTHKEFELLYLLARHPGRVFNREFLLETIWGYEYIGESRTIDVHIRNIRKKLEGDYIATIRGVGYKFADEG
ncbi:response regulator transcription factor [Vallitalea okinawensis]|uniref:response regulator transcription factor n=1 Tax=Vallitalea okinawensis TaxID=2078660 RepID=UPI000CFA944B|nr:response regulator transcription factor [Vallitalea okinawensis]